MISIIIPLYNVQEYVKRCFDSIIDQTFQDFEVICVDDGSTDETGKICDIYCMKDKRFHVYHIKHYGVGYARNYALSLIQGDWFGYIDADDWVGPNYLETLYKNAIVNQCSISACEFQGRRSSVPDDEYMANNLQIFESARECIHNFICNNNSMYGMVWNKLYRSDLYKDIRFDTLIKCNEDCLYTFEVMSRCDRACKTQEQLYHWCYRNDSACHKRPTRVDFEPAEVFRRLYNKTCFLEDREISETLQLNYISAIVKVLLNAKYSNSDKDVKEAKRQCKEWYKNVVHLLDGRMKCKYVLALHLPWLISIINYIRERA